MLGCEGFEKKAKVDENEEIGVRGCGSEGVLVRFLSGSLVGGVVIVSLSCMMIKTIITSTWKYTRYTRADVSALHDIRGTK